MNVIETCVRPKDEESGLYVYCVEKYTTLRDDVDTVSFGVHL